MAASGDEGLVGRLLSGRYAIGKRIARGGMASVFMATDTRLDRVVAVKIMHSGLGDDVQFTDRFVREARTAAALNHPNVVSVFDQGTDGEIVYLVMEYVPGDTLRDVMRSEAPMSPGRALALIEQVLVALSAAHAAHMIHRDVKPENVLITPDGVVKVTDFGLARAVSAATTATGGTLIGTVSYLAPEIVVNDGADARADVYACGAILYEMLTGFKPHAGESPIQIAYKHVHEDVPPPSESIAGIPPYVDALVERATARNRDQRSADALVLLQQVRQVRRALDAGLDDDPELTRDLLPPVFDAPEDDTGQMAPLVDLDDEEDVEGTIVVADPAYDAGTPVGTQVLDVPEEPLAPPDEPHRPIGLHPAMSPEEYAEAQGAPKRRRGLILLLIALLIAALVAAGGWYAAVGRYVEAPNLVGLSLEDAQAEAEAAGFEVEVTERVYHESEPPGTVLATSPEPDGRILPGGTIALTVSQGAETYELPDVRGKTVEEARAELEAITLVVDEEVDERYSNTYAEGEVIGVIDIRPGTEVQNGQQVKLAVSIGREPLDVPDVTGQSGEEAERTLSDAGFEVSVEREFSDDVDEGTVISQSPEPEARAYRGDTVTVVVSRGPEFVEVPNLLGDTGAEAARKLRDLGLDVEFRGNRDGRVMNWNPKGRQRVGTTITLRMFGGD